MQLWPIFTREKERERGEGEGGGLTCIGVASDHKLSTDKAAFGSGFSCGPSAKIPEPVCRTDTVLNVRSSVFAHGNSYTVRLRHLWRLKKKLLTFANTLTV